MQPKPQQRRKKVAPKPQYKNLNAFKAQEKHYKLYQNHETDFSKLFVPSAQNFVQVDGYQICQLPFPQGAYYVKNFTPFQKVMEIVYFGLNHYCKRPYRTNLDSRQELYPDEKQVEKLQPAVLEKTQVKQESEIEVKMEQTEFEKQKIERKQQKQNCFIIQNGYCFNEKIRWANVGYQYDWTLRKYPQLKTPIHPSIQQLSDKANSLYNKIQHIQKNYEPQSAIINYYGQKDYMTGHLDDAEIDQQSPIYSFSFGLSCIFIIGGRTKQQEPTAIRLNSGDLLIMAGQSRKCYHGVPRVLAQTLKEPEQEQENVTKIKIKELQEKTSEKIQKQSHNSYENCKNYIRTHRININIRQVYPRN